MKFHVLYVSSVSACFELENSAPYYAEENYDVYVNGSPALLGVRTNVFSLFDLQPETEYTIAVGEDSLTITTRQETACLNVRDFGAKGDGVTDDTFAIQNAIYVCPRGGRVRVPTGTYAVRPLVLKSHMTLELCEGALLLADTCEEHYPLFPGEIHDDLTEKAVQVST
jgi:polygalacturonase